METNEKKSKRRISQLEMILVRSGKLSLRWLYLITLVVVLAYAFFVWNRYIINAEWNDQQKNDYIKQQAVFSFDRNAFQKATDFAQKKKDQLAKPQKFSGRDIFFPEGF